MNKEWCRESNPIVNTLISPLFNINQTIRTSHSFAERLNILMNIRNSFHFEFLQWASIGSNDLGLIMQTMSGVEDPDNYTHILLKIVFYEWAATSWEKEENSLSRKRWRTSQEILEMYKNNKFQCRLKKAECNMLRWHLDFLRNKLRNNFAPKYAQSLYSVQRNLRSVHMNYATIYTATPWNHILRQTSWEF